MYDIIINPVAGGNSTRRDAKTIYGYLKKNNIAHKIHFSEHPKHISEIMKSITSQRTERKVIVVGGDGTFNEALSGIENFDKTTLGFIPTGSGNDFAHSMRLKRNPIAALEDILLENTGAIDYIQCGDIRSINVIATGLDTEVLNKYNRAKVFKGKVAYILALLGVLMRFKFYQFEIKADDRDISGEFMLAACCNGSRFGGSIPVSPRSDITDGKINLVLIHKVKKIRIPFLLMKFLKGSHLSENWAEEILCDRATITTLNGPKMLETDGELYNNIPFEAEIKAGKLKVFLPTEGTKKEVF